MPPWGATGAFTPEEIVHVVAFLQTLKGPLPPEKDADRNPATRTKPVGFGDNLAPTNNPAALMAEGAETRWDAKGQAGQPLADRNSGWAEAAVSGAACDAAGDEGRYRRARG